MSIEIKTIECPQCGSTEVTMETETQGVCMSCGSRFAVQQSIETQNIYNEIHVHQEEAPAAEEQECFMAEIKTKYSHDDFLRKAWIALARQSAPFEVFNNDFGNVAEKEHQILMIKESADMDFRVSVGYDRQEPYIDYETYWENVPYIAYESQMNKVTHQLEERQVTKYKKEKRERQVTKYKTVTDWKTESGSHSSSAREFEENVEGLYFDQDLFKRTVSEESDAFACASEEDAGRMKVDPAVRKRAMNRINMAHYTSLCKSLPGDHQNNLDYHFTSVSTYEALSLAHEYETSIDCCGKTYTKRAFPFGKMEIGGDVIPNEDSPSEVARKKKAQIPEKIWKSVKGYSFAVMALLLFSIVASFFIHVKALVITAFCVAVAAMIAYWLKEDSDTDRISKEVDGEISDYTANYKKYQLDMLNDKLTSLGFRPAEAGEL